MNFNDKLLIYLYNKQNRLELEAENTRNFARFHRCDQIDYLECIIADTRKNLIQEIIEDIMTLRTTYKPKNK